MPEGLNPVQVQQVAALCRSLAESPGLPTLAARLAAGLAPLVAFDQAALAMKAPDGRLWGLVCPRLSDGSEPGWIELADPESALEEAFGNSVTVQRESRGTSMLAPGLDASTPLRELSLFPFALAVPVRGPDGPLGAIGLFAAGGRFSSTDLNLLSVLSAVVSSTARTLVLAEEVGRAERDLHRMERLRNELVEQLRQEMASPLTVVCNGLDFMQSALLPADAAEVREQVDELRLVAGTTVEMVDSLVQLAQIDDGTLALNPTPVAIDALLRERATLRSAAARMGDVQVLVRCDPADAQTIMDAALVGRVIDTLLLNALRHTPRRGQVALVAMSRPDTLTFAVADTGSPVAAADRESLLERGPLGEDKEPASRAFGLAFANAAVGYLGGQLSVETTQGAGNIFRISLPQ